METSYELWDLESGNAVGWFTTLDEGLDTVRHLLDAYGRNYAHDLDLSQREGDGPAVTVAAGDKLIEMVEHAALKQVARP